MALSRPVVADSGSNEVAELRRTVNSLLLMLETAAASITAGASAEDVLTAWAEGIAAGSDSNPSAIADIVSTGRELAGQTPIPNVPLTGRRELIALDPNS